MIDNLDLTEFLQSYLPTKFPDYKISGDNFMINSIFEEDRKHKLGINLTTGIFHCFKSGEKGNFVKFYSLVEKIPYSQAQIKLNYKVFLKDTPAKPSFRNLVRSYHSEEQLLNAIPVDPDSYDSSNELVKDAWHYLMTRKLFDLENEANNNFMVCEEGFYKNRLIIPYIHEGHIIYFQGRALREGMKPKYLCAVEGAALTRGADVLYPFDLKQDYVVVCEGPVDARSLQLQGVNATCTTGCVTSDNQLVALRWFGKKIIFGYDNDDAGRGGLRRAEKERKKKMMKELHYCFPPSPYKDWNEAHANSFDLKTYIKENSKPYSFESISLSSLDSIR